MCGVVVLCVCDWFVWVLFVCGFVLILCFGEIVLFEWVCCYVVGCVYVDGVWDVVVVVDGDEVVGVGG